MHPRNAAKRDLKGVLQDPAHDILQFSANEIIGTLRTQRLVARRLHCDRWWGEYGQHEYNDPFGRIFSLVSGSAKVSHHGRTFELKPGFLYAIPAFTPSRYQCDHMELFYLHYCANVLSALEPFEYFGWDFEVPARPTAEVRRIWNLLIREESPQNEPLALQQDAGVRQFLAHFASVHRDESVETQSLHRFHPVFSHVERNLHRPLPLAELAALVHLHPTYFSNTFTRAAGLTPTEYVIRKRVERAQTQLLGTSAPLKEIAAQLGFTDVFYFSRTFRRIVGVPPSEYRARALIAP
jgi:AraC family transcriptional regulator of arabinose operon